jgi:hypothetical protein
MPLYAVLLYGITASSKPQEARLVRGHYMGRVITLSSIFSASRCLPHIPGRF